MSGVATAGGESGEPEACVAFSGTQEGSLTGHAELTAHRRNSELESMRLKRMKPGAIHIFWLQPEARKDFWFGSVIKADRRGTFQGDADIAGPSAVAERHVKRTRAALVTSTSKRRARRIVKRYRRSGWKKSGKAMGRVVAQGELSPPNEQGFWPCHRP